MVYSDGSGVSLNARIAALELALARARRRSLIIGLLALALGAAALGLAWPSSKLAASRIELVSDNGDAKMELDANGIRAAQGLASLGLEVRDGSARLTLSGGEKGAFTTVAASFESASVELFTPTYGQRLSVSNDWATLDLTHQGHGPFESVSLRVADDSETLTLGGLNGDRHHGAEIHAADGGAWISASSPTESARISLTNVEHAGPTLSLYRPGGPQIELGTTQRSPPGLRIDGRERLLPAPE